MPTDKRYPAKLLLFGEYTTLLSSDVLAVPLSSKYGFWSIAKDGYTPGNTEKLLAWAKYLSNLELQINLDTLLRDIHLGLVFKSNIPIGYGLGSSGSLTAALYDQYCPLLHKHDNTPEQMKYFLSLIESFFHGNSSGIDPLVSFLNKPVLMRDLKIQIVPINPNPTLHLFLLDSGTARSTQNLVFRFKHLLDAQSTFKKEMEKLSFLQNEAIKYFISNSIDSFWPIVKEISYHQINHMAWLWPDNIKKLAEKGLKEDHFCIKLCGAGGGGYFQLFSRVEDVFDILQFHENPNPLEKVVLHHEVD